MTIDDATPPLTRVAGPEAAAARAPSTELALGSTGRVPRAQALYAAAQAGAAGAGAGDQVTLSPEARAIVAALQRMSQEPPAVPAAHAARIAQLRDSLAKGTFKVDAERLAASIMADVGRSP